MQILPEIQNEYGRLDTVVVGLAAANGWSARIGGMLRCTQL